MPDGFFYTKKGEHRDVYFRGEQEKSLHTVFEHKRMESRDFVKQRNGGVHMCCCL